MTDNSTNITAHLKLTHEIDILAARRLAALIFGSTNLPATSTGVAS